jgi:hypothetical protein
MKYKNYINRNRKKFIIYIFFLIMGYYSHSVAMEDEGNKEKVKQYRKVKIRGKQTEIDKNTETEEKGVSNRSGGIEEKKTTLVQALIPVEEEKKEPKEKERKGVESKEKPKGRLINLKKVKEGLNESKQEERKSEDKKISVGLNNLTDTAQIEAQRGGIYKSDQGLIYETYTETGSETVIDHIKEHCSSLVNKKRKFKHSVFEDNTRASEDFVRVIDEIYEKCSKEVDVDTELVFNNVKIDLETISGKSYEYLVNSEMIDDYSYKWTIEPSGQKKQYPVTGVDSKDKYEIKRGYQLFLDRGDDGWHVVTFYPYE